MNRTVVIVGAAVTVPLLIVLALGFGKDPHAVRTPLIGRVAPDFTLPEVGSQKRWHLGELRGKPVVLNFWATWCIPCGEEHPALHAIGKAWRERATFLGVVYQDEDAPIAEFLKVRGSSFPALHDDGGRVSIAYGVTGVPETFLIDANGTIADKITGPVDPSELVAKLSALTAAAGGTTTGGSAAQTGQPAPTPAPPPATGTTP